MGMQSLVLFNNDQLQDMERDPQRFVRSLVQRLGSGHRDERPDPFGAQVLAITHASQSVLVAAGGGIGRVVGYSLGGGVFGSSQGPAIHTEEGLVQLLSEVAEQHGYRLARDTRKR